MYSMFTAGDPSQGCTSRKDNPQLQCPCYGSLVSGICQAALNCQAVLLPQIVWESRRAPVSVACAALHAAPLSLLNLRSIRLWILWLLLGVPVLVLL